MLSDRDTHGDVRHQCCRFICTVVAGCRRCSLGRLLSRLLRMLLFRWSLPTGKQSRCLSLRHCVCVALASPLMSEIKRDRIETLTLCYVT